MDTDNEKNEQRFTLNRQHVAEWDAQLALEVQERITLDDKHKEEHTWTYSDEINFIGRAALTAKHLKEIKELVSHHRAIRIAMRLRHQQEDEELRRSQQAT